MSSWEEVEEEEEEGECVKGWERVPRFVLTGTFGHSANPRSRTDHPVSTSVTCLHLFVVARCVLNGL